MMSAETPIVFVSYSHDSPEHKRWVAKFSAVLRENGIDIILDQWDLGLGDDLAIFMERGLRDSDRVLVICTDEYNRKANGGIGGVGYEKMIVTADLLKDISTNKFIPIIRDITEGNKTPTCLSTRAYVDLSSFSENDLTANCIKKLLEELHNIPDKSKPPLGKNPFSILPLGEESKAINVKIDINGRENSASDIYRLAVDLARAGDLLGWRQLVKDVKKPVTSNLIKWREKYDANPPSDNQSLHKAVDEAVQTISGLIAIALAGVESGRDALKDQRSLFDLFYNIVGWNYAGRTILIHLPRALGFVYHSLHGAMCLATGQYDVALGLANLKVKDELHSYTSPLWKEHTLMGWTDALGQNCSLAWQYLYDACQRWDWLIDIFGSEFDYRTYVTAYYTSLNIYDLADFLTNREDKMNLDLSVRADIPMCFLREDRNIVQKAINLIASHGDKPKVIWESLGVSKSDMIQAWPKWQDITKKWLWDIYQKPIVARRELPNNNLLELIGSEQVGK